jgi:energy-coupling factor transporter ATP-binding protein EcfA2
MKNMSYLEMESEIDRMLELVSIPDKKHAFIPSLSGGQKRKV